MAKIGNTRSFGLAQFYDGVASQDVSSWLAAWCSRANKSALSKDAFPTKASLVRQKRLKQISEWRDSANFLASFDIITTVCGCLLPHSLLELMQTPDGDEANDLLKKRAAVSLFFYIQQHLEAVNLLIGDGHDLACRTLARNIAEACDMLILSQDSKEFSRQYFEAGDGFREFYHQNMGRKKMAAARRHALRDIFAEGSSEIEELEKYFTEEMEIFSRATHPSYEAGLMFLYKKFPDSEDSDWGFTHSWPNKRMIAFVTTTLSLSMSKFVIDLSKTGSFTVFKNHENVKLVGDEHKEAMAVLLSGCISAASIAANYYNEQIKI